MPGVVGVLPGNDAILGRVQETIPGRAAADVLITIKEGDSIVSRNKLAYDLRRAIR